MRKNHTTAAPDTFEQTHTKKEEEVTETPASPSRRKFLGNVSGATAATIVAGVAGLPAISEEAQAQDVVATSAPARVEQAYNLRVQAALFQKLQPLPDHPNNGDEERYPNRIGNFSKSLPHNQYGEVDQSAYNMYLQATNSGNPDDFERIRMGGDAQLKNPQAGLAFALEGPDPVHVYQPPAPAFASAEIASEIAENYWMALTRDVFFLDYDSHPLTNAAAQDLTKFSDFRGPRFRPNASRSRSGSQSSTFTAQTQSSDERFEGQVVGEMNSERGFQSLGAAPIRKLFAGPITPATLFRGNTPGDLVGPYISQFLWKDIPYGVQSISQKMRTTIPGDDYLTTFSDWLFAQNSRGDKNLPNRYDLTRRYIRNGRDLGEWVHIDVLFQAYFNATLLLLGMSAKLDANNPYNEYRTQCAFGTFGPPHIQSMVCAVATNALRAVWYQKWFVHRRQRPEEFAGRIHNHLTNTVKYPINQEILNSAAVQEVFRKFGTYLLPMAFVEGCPTHPAYGAGHATVAGACVTVLKAWFDEDWVIPDPVVPTSDGLSLVPYRGADLTVGNELNKLAANVAFGRNIAGVHWRSDAWESLKLGEAVTIGILTDMKSCYNENFNGFSLTKFDGTRITV